jgi:hypothetical protein
LLLLRNFIKDCDAALEQRGSASRRLDPACAAIKQLHPECVLQIGHRFRDGGLRNAERRGRLAHAAALRHREKNV